MSTRLGVASPVLSVIFSTLAPKHPLNSVISSYIISDQDFAGLKKKSYTVYRKE